MACQLLTQPANSSLPAWQVTTDCCRYHRIAPMSVRHICTSLYMSFAKRNKLVDNTYYITLKIIVSSARHLHVVLAVIYANDFVWSVPMVDIVHREHANQLDDTLNQLDRLRRKLMSKIDDFLTCVRQMDVAAKEHRLFYECKQTIVWRHYI